MNMTSQQNTTSQIQERLKDWKLLTEFWMREQGLPFVLPHHPSKVMIKPLIQCQCIFLLGVILVATINYFSDIWGTRTFFLYSVSVVAAFLLYDYTLGVKCDEPKFGMQVWKYACVSLSLFVLFPLSYNSFSSSFLFLSIIMLALLLLCCLIYYGLLSIPIWLLKSTVTYPRYLVHFFPLVQSLVVIFFFLNTPVWEVASHFYVTKPLLVVSPILVCIFLFTYFLFKQKLQVKNKVFGRFNNWDDIEKNLGQTGNIKLPEETCLAISEAKGNVFKRGKDNQQVLMNCRLLLNLDKFRFLFAGLIAGVIFFCIGLLTISPAIIEKWTKQSVEEYASHDLFGLLGRDIVISRELVVVAIFIAVVSALQFKIAAAIKTDEKKLLADELENEINCVLAVREIYMTLFKQSRTRLSRWHRFFEWVAG